MSYSLQSPDSDFAGRPLAPLPETANKKLDFFSILTLVFEPCVTNVYLHVQSKKKLHAMHLFLKGLPPSFLRYLESSLEKPVNWEKHTPIILGGWTLS